MKSALEATLEAFQVSKAQELVCGLKVHDRENYDSILKHIRSHLPDSVQGELALDGCDSSKAAQQLLLKRHVLGFRDRPAVVVI
jgi:hypothetical protein